MNSYNNTVISTNITNTYKIKNRGTGAGGRKTNKNGLSYEKITDLDSEYIEIENGKYSVEIIFKLNKKILFVMMKGKNFQKYMKKYAAENIHSAHGCKKPDECFINESDKNIFIIEKKFQQVGGSVCEKIQTPEFKLWQYNRQYPKYNFIYIYCLSEWFGDNCQAELEYLKYKKIPFFFGNDKNYKNEIISFIINYK